MKLKYLTILLEEAENFKKFFDTPTLVPESVSDVEYHERMYDVHSYRIMDSAKILQVFLEPLEASFWYKEQDFTVVYSYDYTPITSRHDGKPTISARADIVLTAYTGESLELYMDRLTWKCLLFKADNLIRNARSKGLIDK